MTASLNRYGARLKALSAGPLLRGLAAYGGAELANRAVRLVATVVIARQLAPAIVGEAALVLTVFELVRVLARTGVGQRIIACEAADLDAVCNTAHRLFWQWSLVLVAVQLGAAALLAFGFGRSQGGAMLAVLALVYPLMPGGLVQCHLAMREVRNGRMARTAATQAIADHILTAGLLLIWPSPWSIILPKLLTAPIWLVMTRRTRPWTPNAAAGHVPLGDMLRFSSGVLAAEALAALRSQGDNLIIAATMGTAALGTYYFAYNAGIGIVSSLVGAFGTVAFPLLCKATAGIDRRAALKRIVLGGGVVFVPLIAAQSLLAPLYVPVVFGAHWAFAAPLIAVLCLAGLPLLASTLTTTWLRAEGRTGIDASASLATCIAALGGLAIGTTFGSLEAAVIGLVTGHTLVAAFFAHRILVSVLKAGRTETSLKEQLA